MRSFYETYYNARVHTAPVPAMCNNREAYLLTDKTPVEFITGRLSQHLYVGSLPTASPETKTKNYRKSRLIKVLSHQGQFSDLKVANNPINLRKLHFPTHSSQLLSPKIYTCSRDSDADLSDRTEACRLDAE